MTLHATKIELEFHSIKLNSISISFEYIQSDLDSID
jgi:hypothetical protein